MDKSEDLQTKEVKETCAGCAGHSGIQDTKAMVMTIIVLFKIILFSSFTGRCRRLTSPMGAKEIDIRKKHGPERTERTLRFVGQNARKAGVKEVAHSFGETAQKTGKNWRAA